MIYTLSVRLLACQLYGMERKAQDESAQLRTDHQHAVDALTEQLEVMGEDMDQVK